METTPTTEAHRANTHTTDSDNAYCTTCKGMRVVRQGLCTGTPSATAGQDRRSLRERRADEARSRERREHARAWERLPAMNCTGRLGCECLNCAG